MVGSEVRQYLTTRFATLLPVPVVDTQTISIIIGSFF